MAGVTFEEELDHLVRARYSLIYLVTHEEERAHGLVMKLASAQGKHLFEWSVTNGCRHVHSPRASNAPMTMPPLREPLAVLNEILQRDLPAIYILKDFHSHLEPPEVVRQLRDLALALRNTHKTILIVSPVLNVPPELEKAVTILDLPLPAKEHLSRLLDRIVSDARAHRAFSVDLAREDRDRLVQAALGLTLVEAENAYAKAIIRDGRLDASDVDAIIDEKKQVIRKSGVLDYYEASEKMSEVGGMDLLKAWLDKRGRAFGEKARAYGLPEPRGILLMGVQGCGKSLISKAVASAWKLPLLRMDMSMIFQAYIGHSEQNMRKALQVAESLAPVVLWIDEIEKAFAGLGSSGSADAGTTARVLGQFLTWMQEKKAPVFTVATANDVQGLPPELIRKGRLDEVFFIDLPRGADREEILRIHIAKLGRDPQRHDIEVLSKASRGFSGAEIEQAIVAALHDSFFADRELTTEDIIHSFKETVPLSVTMREKIQELRTWAQRRARPVSSLQARTPAAGAQPAQDASRHGPV